MLLGFAVVTAGEVAKEATGSKEETMCSNKVPKKKLRLKTLSDLSLQLFIRQYTHSHPSSIVNTQFLLT